MLTAFEKRFCDELLETGKILKESHFGDNHNYLVEYDENNTFTITKENGEWIYIYRCN